MPTLHPQLVKA